MFSTRHAAVALGFAASMAAVLLLAPRTQAQQPAGPPSWPQPPVTGPQSIEPLELFAELMPVFTHPRCANCHSQIDPRDEAAYRNHKGGFVRGETCTERCHTDEPDWTRVAPQRLWFTGLDTKAMCLLQQDFVKRRGGEAYLSHLSTDKLILAGFAGTRAGMTDVADPPPMDKVTFVEKAAEWVYFGMAKCGHWAGTITQTERLLDGTYEYPWEGFMPPSIVQVSEEAERVLTLKRQRGASTITYNSVGGHSEMTRTAFIPLDGGICKTVYQSNSIWSIREHGPLPAGIDIKIAIDGTYSIRFVLPIETTYQVDNDTMVSECVSLPRAEHDPNVDLTWSPWKFLIRCPPSFQQDVASGNFIDCDLFDPENMPRLKGSMTRTIREHEDAAEPQSWLRVSPASGSRADSAKSLPIKVITTWDFEVVE